MEYLETLLQLPEVSSERPIISRRPVVNPQERVDSLKSQQAEAFWGLVQDLQDPNVNWTVLEGYAGTGKSYLIATLIEYVLFHWRKQVSMTAPTNKAVKVLRKEAMYNSPNLDFLTIHSLLGLREQIDGYGRQKFVQMNRDACKIGEKDILIIDESSMLSDELFDLIEPYVTTGDLKVIFVGDPCQIPPVGMDQSIPFKEAKRKELGMKHYALTEIVRQAEGNPIIEATMKLRSVLNRDIAFPVKESKYDEATGDGIHWFDSTRKPDMVKLLTTYFTSPNFKADADFAKVVCWTNDAVDGFNQLIRKKIYGADLKFMMKGEKLIANKPIIETMDGEKVIVFNNNDEFEVLDYQVKNGNWKGTPLNYYETLVEYCTPTGEVGTQHIKIIHEDSIEAYIGILDNLTELAQAEKKGSWEAAQKWKDWFAFKEIFADVSYNYAITGHKSQGSTYENCFVVEPDIDRNRKTTEKNRIKYTAFSRPKKKLFVIC